MIFKSLHSIPGYRTLRCRAAQHSVMRSQFQIRTFSYRRQAKLPRQKPFRKSIFSRLVRLKTVLNLPSLFCRTRERRVASSASFPERVQSQAAGTPRESDVKVLGVTSKPSSSVTKSEQAVLGTSLSIHWVACELKNSISSVPVKTFPGVTRKRAGHAARRLS